MSFGCPLIIPVCYSVGSATRARKSSRASTTGLPIRPSHAATASVPTGGSKWIATEACRLAWMRRASSTSSSSPQNSSPQNSTLQASTSPKLYLLPAYARSASIPFASAVRTILRSCRLAFLMRRHPALLCHTRKSRGSKWQRQSEKKTRLSPSNSADSRRSRIGPRGASVVVGSRLTGSPTRLHTLADDTSFVNLWRNYSNRRRASLQHRVFLQNRRDVRSRAPSWAPKVTGTV